MKMKHHPWPSRLYLDGLDLLADGNAIDALELLRAAQRECVREGELHGIAHCLRLIGIAQADIEQFADSIKTLHQALELLTDLDDPELTADCAGELGLVLADTGDKREAIMWLQRSCDLFESWGDVETGAAYCGVLAELYEDSGAVAHAYAAFSRAARGFFATGQIEESARCHEGGGSCLLEMEDITSAKAQFTIARTLYREVDKGPEAARCQYLIGITSTVEDLADAEIELHAAIDFFRTAEVPDAEGDCWEQLGDLYFEAKRVTDAVESYRAAIALHSHTDRPSRSAHCHRQLGLLLLHLRMIDDAITSLVSARNLFADEHPDDAAGIDVGLGMIYEDQGRHSDAVDAYNRARQAHTRLGDIVSVATCDMHLATVQMQLGDLVSAERLLISALAEFSAAEEPVLRATCLRYFGALAREKLELSRAEDFVNQSLALIVGLGESELEADCRQELALVLMQNAEYEAAIDGLEFARAAFVNGENVEKSAACQQSIGVCLLSLGRYDDAEQALLESRKAFSNSGIRFGVATSDSHLSQVYLEAGRLADAENSFVKARAAFDSFGSTDRVAMVDQNVGGLHVARGDFDLAEAAFSSAAELFAGLGQHARAAVCRCNIGVVAFMTSDFVRAKKVLTEAIEDFGSDLAYRRNVGWCQRNLACAEIMEGSPGTALVHLGAARELFLALRTMIDVAKCDFLAAVSIIAASGGERYREALELALPAVQYVNAQRFQFEIASSRLSWEKTASQWMAEIFVWADKLGDRQLLSELVESTINSGTHVAEISADRFLTDVDIESPTPQIADDAGLGMGGASALVAGAALPMRPPPLLQMPGGQIALERYLRSMDTRYGTVSGPTVVPVI